MTTTTSSLLTCFFKGAAIGLAIAAPVGPIGVLCIRRSLANGALIGFATGMGAATADALYGAVAGFGLTAVATFLERQQFWLGLLGGVFLCYLGVRTFSARPRGETSTLGSEKTFTAYGATLFLTLTNPATIFSFIAVFAGIGVSANYSAASALVGGVFVGSALWWLFLSLCVGALRARFNSRWMQIVNRVSGIIMIGFGCYALSRML